MATGFDTTASPPSIDKDPHAVLDYAIYWGDWLGTSDTIASATWTVPSGLTKISQAINAGVETVTLPSGASQTCAIGTLAGVVLSGGISGMDYTVACKITSANSLTDERSFKVRCRQR